MAILRKLLAYLVATENGGPVVFPSLSGGYVPAGELDEYYATLRETRAYVVAMREVAADTTRSW